MKEALKIYTQCTAVHYYVCVKKRGVAESVMIFRQLFTKKLEFYVLPLSDFIIKSATPVLANKFMSLF